MSKVVSIDSFRNNGFYKGCNKDKLIDAAKYDINQLIKENEKLQSNLNDLVLCIYEHVEEGTELMQLAEKIDER